MSGNLYREDPDTPKSGNGLYAILIIIGIIMVILMIKNGGL